MSSESEESKGNLFPALTAVGFRLTLTFASLSTGLYKSDSNPKKTQEQCKSTSSDTTTGYREISIHLEETLSGSNSGIIVIVPATRVGLAAGCRLADGCRSPTSPLDRESTTPLFFPVMKDNAEAPGDDGGHCSPVPFREFNRRLTDDNEPCELVELMQEVSSMIRETEAFLTKEAPRTAVRKGREAGNDKPAIRRSARVREKDDVRARAL
ncbi:hypothetical protein BS50DRAFT_641186 [Corynespora cassiicola Philippines]|uniref:Uncharacterized protein n=1 Tax=Corynespora cassiicola Philippines TaxID=1448308 RepID=A0A2T2N1M3_CORCC|nr:hypothetical protein BS50DRAFT_641186 [Corynespora cassiicola Philippines]